MASNLACVGLAVDDNQQLDELVRVALGASREIGRAGAAKVFRWQDPSGARLTATVEGDRITELMPSFAGAVGARLAGLRVLAGNACHAAVLDEAGEQATALTLDLEQAALLRGAAVDGAASLVALGSRVAVFADEASFGASPESLLARDTAVDSEPPEHYRRMGWPWPPRVAAESFISYGAFAPDNEPTSRARMYGTVERAQQATNGLTGQQFVVVRVRSAGFEADVCFPATEQPEIPPPGAIVGGDVYMVGSLIDWTAGPRGRSTRPPA